MKLEVFTNWKSAPGGGWRRGVVVVVVVGGGLTDEFTASCAA